ncbi:iron complex transport system permease protein [Pullulanibacillus pueri]|nr:iron complex transport system permease protein [Pullulanibacillus pueri]
MAHNTRTQHELTRQQAGPYLGVLTLVLGLVLLVLGFGLSVAVGATDISLKTVWDAVFHYNSALTSHQIIQEVRLPRAIGGALVGAMLAVSGAMMQGMTRNPLADPSIMGVTDGSALALAIAFAFFPGLSYFSQMLLSFVGAGLGVVLVFGVGALAKGNLTPVKLALAGVAIAALLHSLSSGIAIHYEVAQGMSFFYAGGLVGVNWTSIKLLLPIFIIGMILAFILARAMTVLTLGESVAKGLGQRTGLIKGFGMLTILLLTGAAVSVAGTIGFIGLVIPHITRFIVGVDYRWNIPCSAVVGGLLLVFADIGSRLINPPFETPVGAITAFIGVPIFLYLTRRVGRGL